MLRRLLAVAAIALVGLSSCSEKTKEEVSTTLDSATDKIGTAAEKTIDTIKSKVDNIGNDSAEVANMQKVKVTLSDFKIAMPMDLKAGKTRFFIANTGKNEHNFELEGTTGDGAGKEDKLMMNLDPGDSTHLDVDLRAGTYNVYCPVANHADKGMKHKLTVK
jgi:uncharacterized cupredoxin-like copper-binding protein